MKIFLSLPFALGLSVVMSPLAHAQYRGAVRPPAARPAAVRPTVPVPKPSAPVNSPKSVTPPTSTSRSAAGVSPRNPLAIPKSTNNSATSTKPVNTIRPSNAGRSGRQQQLRKVLTDPNASRADKGWVRNEMRQMESKNRTSIRNPPGKELAHARGREAAKGFGYEHSQLNLAKDHRRQHSFDNFGRSNKIRPLNAPNPKPPSASSNSSSLSPKSPGSSSLGSTPKTNPTPPPSSGSPSSGSFTRPKK